MLSPHEQKQTIGDGPVQRAAVEDDFSGEVQHVRRLLGRLRDLDVAPLVERLEEQYATLPRVRPILRGRA
jgi:hypothetical protein